MRPLSRSRPQQPLRAALERLRTRRPAPGGVYTPVLLLLAAIVGISYLGLGFIMPLRALYGRDVGASSIEIGLMAAAFLITGFAATPAMGWVTDRVGPSRVLWVGLLAHGLLVLAYIPAQHPVLLIGLRAVEGIAAAAVLPPARALVNTLGPRDRQGEALGVLSAAQMAGMLLGPAVGSILASGTSYTVAFALASLPLFLGTLAARFFLPRAADTMALRERVGRGREGAVASEQDRESEIASRARLFSRPLLMAYGLQLLLGLTGGVGMTAWALYMADRGSSLFLIGLSYTTFALPSLLLTPLFGRYSDRRARYWPVVVGLFLYGIVVASYELPLTPLAIVLISTLEGIPSALTNSATSGLLADVTPAHAKGRAQANFSAAGTLGSLISATAAGFLYGFDPGLPFLVVGVIYVAAVLALLSPTLARVFPARNVQGGSAETLAALGSLEPAEERSVVGGA